VEASDLALSSFLRRGAGLGREGHHSSPFSPFLRNGRIGMASCGTHLCAMTPLAPVVAIVPGNEQRWKEAVRAKLGSTWDA
jgi:hypothetical protein